jgi:hypothetical protein
VSKTITAQIRYCFAIGVLLLSTHSLAQFEPAIRRSDLKAAIVSAQMVASPYRIDAKALRGIIRYRIRQPADLPISWPATGEQRMVPARVSRPADTVVLEICANCGDEAKPSSAELRAALTSNTWADASDRQIIRLARQSRVPMLSRDRDFFRDDPRRIRRYFARMLTTIRAHFTDLTDLAESQTASQAVRTRRADCGEFALVFAAIAKARGIPARVAFGMKYSRHDYQKAHQFMPHVWTQLWDGQRWISVDAAMLTFDAGHIAIAVGDGQPAAVIRSIMARSKLVIEAAGSMPQ